MPKWNGGLGAALLCMALACGGGGAGTEKPSPVVPTATPLPDPTPTGTPAPSPTPTATPTPTAYPQLVDLGVADYSAGAKGPFARNPWDMTYFQGRLYIGQGNSDNEGSPDGNAGPVKIVSLVPGTPGFRYEGYGTASNLPEEQIDVIRVIDGSLFIPGHDPELDWTIRTFYKRTAASEIWEQSKSTNATAGSSWGIHGYDITGFNGKLFACGQSYAVSSDGGQTWSYAGSSARCTALITVGGKLYGATYYPDFGLDEYNPQTGMFESRNDVFQSRWAWLVPGLQMSDPANAVLKIVRPIAMGSAALYLAGYPSSDHQTGTLDVYRAKSFEAGAFDVVRTTPTGERPWDLLARGTTAFLLTSRKSGSGASERFAVTIWKSAADFGRWTLLYSFPDLATFARSFEEVNGDFYLGLGTDDGQVPSDAWDVSYTSNLKADSGRILWVKTHD